MGCLLYARVSTDRQAEKDLSIPAQLQFMQEYAKRQGWAVIGHYIDEGESARTADRPELKRLLHYCQKHRDADVVLIHKIDRLARNLVDYATIKAVLKRRGIRLVSVAEPFAEGPVGQLMENIIASISEWYSANLGEEIKKAAVAKLQRGEWPAGPAPLGYRTIRDEDKRIQHVHDPDTAPLVRQAFELYATSQYSLNLLGEEMAERGLRTSRGKPYSEQMTQRLLSRRFYIGKIIWSGKEYAGRHPPLIPESLFYRVQDVLAARHRDTGEKGRLYFLLRGIAVCKTCGQRLTAERHQRGNYYRCMPDAHCAEPYVPVDLLDDQLAYLYGRLQAPRELIETVRFEIETMAAERAAVAAKEQTRLKRILAALETKELKLVDALVSTRVSRDAYDKLSKRYLEERRAAEGRLAQLEVDFADSLAFLDKCLAVAGSLASLHREFEPERRKLLARAVFKRISVQDRGIVGISLNEPFSLILAGQVAALFEDAPRLRTERDIFEQVVAYTLSPEYEDMKALLSSLLKEKGESAQEATAAA